MSTLILNHNYHDNLRDATPTYFPAKKINPPPGVQGDVHFVDNIVIPPLNTSIQFDSLAPFTLANNRGLSDLSVAIPENFNWRHNARERGKEGLIVTPGNQMLCGSCWAIAAAGVISDNFTVSGLVDWYPNLSTTWILSCYPQQQCKGGNPSITFTDIARGGGVVSNHCVDYSWCASDITCNGEGTKHFDAKNVNLSALIPQVCGCMSDSEPQPEFFYYKIKEGTTNISIGVGDITDVNMPPLIKKHIMTTGPVLGGFLVFENFMHGTWAKINGGVYMENATYDGGNITFNENNVSASKYKGSHAVSIIGHGVEKGVQVDANGTKKDVPYWYCRNSWGTKWGDGGYFKMAMYPINKLSQFDKKVTLITPAGSVASGGMILIKPLAKPEKQTFSHIQEKIKNINPDSYYTNDPSTPPTPTPSPSPSPSPLFLSPLPPSPPGPSRTGKGMSKSMKLFLVIMIISIVLFLVAFLVYILVNEHNASRPKQYGSPQASSRPTQYASPQAPF